MLYSFYSRYFGKISVVGVQLEKEAGELRCLFFDHGDTTNFIASKLLSSNATVYLVKRIWIPQLRNILYNNQFNVELCIAVLPKKYQLMFDGMSTFKSNKLVIQKNDLSGSMDDIRKLFHDDIKCVSKKIIKQNYSYRISNTLEDYVYFYEKMYLPYTTRRHGRLAHVESFEELKKFFDSGALLFILESNRPIAGGVIWFDGNSVVVRRVAVIDGDLQYLKNHAVSAINYFVLQYAKEMGYASVNNMGSLSFMKNGVYLSKRAWGAIASIDINDEDVMYYFNIINSNKLAKFYSMVQPIVIDRENGELIGIIGVTDEKLVDFRNIYNKYGRQGINTIATINCKGELNIFRT